MLAQDVVVNDKIKLKVGSPEDETEVQKVSTVVSDADCEGVEVEDGQLERTMDNELREEKLNTGLIEVAKENEGTLVGVCIEEADSVDVMVEQIEEEVDRDIDVVGEPLTVAVKHAVGVINELMEEVEEIEMEEEVDCVEDTDSVGVRVGL